MTAFENYKSNLDVVDKYNLKRIKISTDILYSGKTEYVNPQIKSVDHTSPLLAAAILGLDNTGAPIPENTKFLDTWTDIDAQEIHLSTKPTCYMILGKTDSEAFNLGEAMAKKYNVIHLCPKNILLDEISQKSNAGRTWDFNMKHNKVCLYDMILSMLKIKLNSEVVQHRGYVISGLPLVTSNRNPLCFINSLHGEEAFLYIDEMLFETIRNLKKKKQKPPGSGPSSRSSEMLAEEEEKVEEEPSDVQDEESLEEEEEDKPAELPKFLLDTCSDIIYSKKSRFESKVAAYLCQLNELFSLCLKPDIIIHITCPEMDLVKMRGNIYLNYKTGQYTYKPPFISNYVPEPSWPRKCYFDNYENPHASNIFHPKYHCRPPSSYEDIIIEQICNYKTYIYPYIEHKLKDYDPKMVVELDGRISCSEMLHHVAEIIILIHTLPVIIPQPLFLEERPEDMDEFWSNTIAGLDFIRSDNVNFKYYASPWLDRCPVELKLRRTVIGNPKYAVMFFKHIYLMSSLNNFISFYKNPRPYLKLKYLEPICRVIVTGTKSSGKTMISRCLSWIFDAPIINFNTIFENEKEKKYLLISQTILSEIIPTIEDARIHVWQEAETDREKKLSEFCSSALKLLKEYVHLLIMKTKIDENKAQYELKKQKHAEFLAEKARLKREKEELQGEKEEEELEEDIPFQDIKVEDMNPDLLKKFKLLKMKLSFLPILDTIEECKNACDSQNISEYAPIELLTRTNKPSIPVLGDADVTLAINQYIEINDLQKDLEPTTEEVMTEIVKLITAIDAQYQEDTQSEQLYGKYIIDGFPSDPECFNYISDSKLIPDYTIGLIENREIDEELYQHYISADKITRRYDEKIVSANDPLIHTKLQASKSLRFQYDTIRYDIQKIVNDAINDTIDLIFITDTNGQTYLTSDEPLETELQTRFIASLTEAVERYREEWDSLKLKVEENSKFYIEIELENKKDVEIIEEMLRKLRQCYQPRCVERGEEEELDVEDEDDLTAKDLLSYNEPRFLCETSIYCPITYYDHDILWQGNPEFSLTYDNKIHYFCKEEFMELFQKDITKYQFYNKPYKKIPKLKICVIGSIGSGATSLSKHIAKELGLLHIDFAEAINEYLVPKHYKKIGRHYENMFIDESIDEEGIVEFQMDEENVNLLSDIMGNEKELSRMLNDYFERGAPVLSKLMQKVIHKIWFDSISPVGFVLDGYPKLPSDIEDMIGCYAVPDIVIQLENNAETAINRIAPIMLQSWKSQQKEAKKIAAIRLANERKIWLHSITKQIVAKLIIEEVCEKVFFLKKEPLTKSESVESTIIDAHPAGSSNVDPMLFNTYNAMIEEYPEPQDANVWQKTEEAREGIEARIESIFDTDDENIQSLNEILMENRIKTVSVDGTKAFNKVTRYTLSVLTPLKNRCESFFEQTFIVNTDVAESLLLRGYYFLSKFYRLCPVYIFENPQATQNSYKICKRRGTLFPVVHRSFIYYISSAKNVTKFRTNPLKYITCDNIKSYFEAPLRIGVIGAPKSGQSTLAARLAKQYGLLCISGGSAVRRVLENLHWTELAVEMRKHLEAGKSIEEDHIVKAMQTVAINHRTVTCGYVLDGAPMSPYRAKGHIKSRLFPNMIFDISANKSKILENSQKEIYYDIIKYKPPYPRGVIEIRYEKWAESQYKIRDWIAENYKNLYHLDGNHSKWHVLQQANDHIKLINANLHNYVCNVEKNIVRAMWISEEEFQARQSQYKKMCPVCFHNKVYKYMGTHFGGKTGLVQYNKKFYWICDEHLDTVMKFPDHYLTSIDIEFPEMPALINIVNLDFVYENGVCVVTYAENLPAQIIKMGTNQYAASYAGKSYLFCSEVCLCKFISKPYLYKDITIFKESKGFPKLSLKSLPNIGYLEQTLGNMLTEACCAVNVFRPKYPGLSFKLSAFIYIALYLKTHNPLMDKNKLPLYLKASTVFESRCKLMLDVGLRLRSMDNPFATYPKCLHREPTLNPADVEQCPKSCFCLSQLQIPAIDTPKTTSNFVQLHKPSFRKKSTKRPTAISQMKRN